MAYIPFSTNTHFTEEMMFDNGVLPQTMPRSIDPHVGFVLCEKFWILTHLPKGLEPGVVSMPLLDGCLVHGFHVSAIWNSVSVNRLVCLVKIVSS